MILSRWLWLLSGILVTAVVAYTIWVFGSLTEPWSWVHQLISTLISAGFAVVIGFVLYQVQIRDRRRNLRLLLVVQVVETRDRLHERYIASAKLLDGSIGDVVLTSLNSSIFDEAIKSGFFSPEETLLMSRAIGAIDAYNLHATRFQSLPEIPAAGEVEAQAKAERAVISSVMQARDQVLKAMDDIYDQWPAREVHEAFKAHEQRGRTRPATMAEARYLTTKDN